MSSLKPRVTPGTPANDTPIAFRLPPARLVLRCTYHQTGGVVSCRCGSLARSGAFDAVWAPETIQLFEPASGPPTSDKRRFCCSTNVCAAASASRLGAAGALRPVRLDAGAGFGLAEGMVYTLRAG